MNCVIENRIKKIIDKMIKDRVEALIVTKGTDIRYLSGFTGEAGVAVLILTNDKRYLITDGRFTNQASQETSGYEIVKWESKSGIYGETGNILKKISVNQVVIDHAEISYANYESLINAFEKKVKNSKPYITDMRMVKDLGEVQAIRKACEITEKSFLAILNTIKPGQTEAEIRNSLEYEFRKNGAEGIAFESIIASGPDNGANPHATVSSRKIQNGDMITIDFGCKYNGYCSDMTRTIAIGQPSEELLKIYNVVKEAKDNAVLKLKSGVKAKDIDMAIRSVFEKYGYVLPHGPGHGFGLDIHENPFLGPRNEYEMEENVVHTIEPGIYIPGIGGVRIEDDYLITKDGYELLTPNVSQELIIIS